MNVRQDWWGLAQETLLRPRAAARAILALRLPPRVLVELLLLVAILTDLLLYAELAFGGGAGLLMGLAAPDPLLMWVMQLASLVMMMVAVQGLGRLFGGEGTWAGALALVIWLQTIMIGLGLAQLVLYFLLPPLADLLGLVSLGLLLWLLTNFTAVLHGFRNLWLVFFGILVSGVLIVFALSYLLVILGILSPGAA